MSASELIKRMEGDKRVMLIAILLNVPIFIAVLVVNFAAAGPGVEWGWFYNTTAEISEKYTTKITPAGFTFSIWGIIYLYTALWILYTITLLFRPSEGGYLFYTPYFLPFSFYFAFWVSSFGNASWLFVWDRERLDISAPLLFLTALFLVIAVAISMRGLAVYAGELINTGNRKELWLVRALIHNGVGMYATWLTIASFVGLSSTLVYREPFLEDDLASSLCVGVLALLFVIYTLLDNFIIDRNTRYLLTPYLVVIWALLGIIARGFDPDQNSSILVAFALVYGLISSVVKVLLVIARAMTDPEPLYPESYKPLKV